MVGVKPGPLSVMRHSSSWGRRRSSRRPWPAGVFDGVGGDLADREGELAETYPAEARSCGRVLHLGAYLGEVLPREVAFQQEGFGGGAGFLAARAADRSGSAVRFPARHHGRLLSMGVDGYGHGALGVKGELPHPAHASRARRMSTQEIETTSCLVGTV